MPFVSLENVASLEEHHIAFVEFWWSAADACPGSEEMSSEIDDGGNGEMEVGVEIEPSNQGHTQEEEIYAEYW